MPKDEQALPSPEQYRPPAKADCDLPPPPDLLEYVVKEADRRLPAHAHTSLAVLRVSMLLQDAVEAACMCARAHIDAPLLAKHLLGSEQHLQFMALAQAASDDDQTSEAAEAVAEFASAVSSTVGEVCPPRRSGPNHTPLARTRYTASFAGGSDTPSPWSHSAGLLITHPICPVPRLLLSLPQAHARSLGAILHHLCCSVLDAIARQPTPSYDVVPMPDAPATGAGPSGAGSASAGDGGSATAAAAPPATSEKRNASQTSSRRAVGARRSTTKLSA